MLKLRRYPLPLIAILVTLSSVTLGVDPARPGSGKLNTNFRGTRILYDGAVRYRPAPFLFKKGFVDGNGSVSRMSCANLHFYGDTGIVTSASCAISIIGFDFSTAEIFAFVNIMIGNRVYARYLASLSVTATDLFQDNGFEVEELNDKKMDAFARIMNKLSRVDTPLAQKYHVDGTVAIVAKGAVKFDPMGVGFQRPRISETDPFANLHLDRGSKIVRQLTGKTSSHSIPTPELLYDSIGQTLDILWDGYDTLQLNSGNKNRKLLKTKIIENADTIVEEFSLALWLAQEKYFHIVELGHFVNQLTELITAIDEILVEQLNDSSVVIPILNGS